MHRNTGLRTGLLAASSLLLIGLLGCDKPAPAETAGRKIDQTMEKMSQRVDEATMRAKEQTAKASQAIDDTAITAAVKAGILAEPGLKVLKIDVDTKNGVVMLTGSADTAEKVQRAAQVASSVQGVKSVDNRIAVSAKG